MSTEPVTTEPSAAWRSGWWAFGVSVVARTVLGVLVLLLLASTVPALVGWQSSVVMSGSMSPALEAGDLVVLRPVGPAGPETGQVLLVDDPDVPGHLRLHRLVAVEDGMLRLQGDASPQPDGTLVDPAALHGVGVYSLPAVGLPLVWSAEGRQLPLAVAGLGLAALLGLSLLHRAPAAVTRPPAGRRRTGRRTALAAGAMVVVTAGTPGLSPAGAVFSASTSNQANSFAANPYWSCADAATGASAPGYLPLQESAGPTAVNAGTAGAYVSATYRGGITYRATGPTCSSTVKSAVRLNGTSGYLTTNVALNSPQVWTSQLWFATTTTRGGKLIGFGNGADGASSSSYDRHVYMRTDGTLSFGVYNGGYFTVTSPKAYNDGAWHMVTSSFSPGTGMRLYVDGALVASSGASAAAEDYVGYWRVGYDSLGSGWPGSPTSPYFAGSVAHVSIWQAVLSAAEIGRQFQAVG